MWWADVETGNSLSANASVNDFAIDALSYAMQPGVALRSFYSYTSAWNKVAGKGSPPTPTESGCWVAFAGNILNEVSNFVAQNGTSDGAAMTSAPGRSGRRRP